MRGYKKMINWRKKSLSLGMTLIYRMVKYKMVWGRDMTLKYHMVKNKIFLKKAGPLRKNNFF